jgi:hypothetical protein
MMSDAAKKIHNHLTLDFPIKAPANAKALTEELPPLMADFAKTQDDLGTVHYSRFAVHGNEKLLFLADIDGEVDTLIEQLVERARPVFDSIFKHVEDSPTKTVSNSAATIKWLKHHSRGAVAPYSAFEDASVQDIKAAAREAGFTGNTSQGTWHIYVTVKSALKAFTLEHLVIKAVAAKSKAMSDAIGTLHFDYAVAFENHHLGFFTIYDGAFEKYIQDFAERTGPFFDQVFEYVTDPPPAPVAKNAQAFLQWSGQHHHPAIGFYSAYPGLSVQDIRALLADRKAHAGTAA